MAKHSQASADAAPNLPKRAGASGKGSKRLVRALAQGTLLVAGIAATQMRIPERESKFHLFDRTLVDRLQAPITRYHE